jgi:NAD(P)-dependent dehydrogenase (short-subunit alcohol dehydrogenase family)
LQGTSSGLGLALVRRVLARGDRVIATSRVRAAPEGQQQRQFAEALLSLVRGEREDRLRLLELDVSAPFAEVQRQVEAAIAMWGRVDVLVNNAGTVGRAFGPSEELGCVRLFSNDFVVCCNFLRTIFFFF